MRKAVSLFMVGLFCSNALAGDITAEVTRQGEVAHLEFRGASSWKVKTRKEGNALILDMPELPEKTINVLRSAVVPLIKRITVEPGPNAGHSVKIQMESSRAEAFDYLTDQPSRFIVDIYIPETHTPVAIKAEGQPSTLPEKKTAARKNFKKVTRKPAADYVEVVAEKGKVDTDTKGRKGVWDGGDPDFTRFSLRDSEINESSVIASRHNIYLDFPMMERKTGLIGAILAVPPVYEVADGKTEEDKQAQLLLTLFKNGRDNVFLKTLDTFFRKDFPNSKYSEMFRYMEADLHFKKWLKDKDAAAFDIAVTRYRALVEEFPKSPLAERTALLTGYAYFDRGDYFNALKSFQRFLKQNKDSRFKHHVRLSLGKTFVGLRDYKAAIHTLAELESDISAGSIRAEAAVIAANAEFAAQNYDEAINRYEKVLKEHPSAKEFPEVFYNLAETQFRSKKYKKSLDAFIEFLKRFPSSKFGGYAMTRVGELQEILGGPEEKRRGAFLESMFRYSGGDGAGVARIRLLSRRMPEMKEKEIQENIKGIDDFVAVSSLPRLKEFRALMVADGYFGSQRYEEAIKTLIDFYQANPMVNLSPFRTRILKNIATQIRDQSEGGEFMKAFETYGRYASTWLKPARRIDVEYFLGRSYEQANVPKKARESYERALNRLYAIKGTQKEKVVRIHEIVPDEAVLNLRIAAVAATEKKWPTVIRHLAAVKDPEALPEKNQVEFVELNMRTALVRNDLSSARRWLTELIGRWKGRPAEVTRPQLHLAEIEAEEHHYGAALAQIEKIINLASDSGEVPSETLAGALELKGNVLVKAGQIEEAAEAFRSLLDKYEETRSLEPIRYRLGNLYFEKGNLAGAEKVWSGLKEGTTWSKLANERLGHAKWADEHKKYIDRAPANEGRVK